MLSKIILAGVTVMALTTSGIAATSHRDNVTGRWVVLQDAGGGACYVANRQAGPDEGQFSGTFATEGQAQAALEAIPACEAINVDPGRDSAQSNG